MYDFHESVRDCADIFFFEIGHAHLCSITNLLFISPLTVPLCSYLLVITGPEEGTNMGFETLPETTKPTPANSSKARFYIQNTAKVLDQVE